MAQNFSMLQFRQASPSSTTYTCAKTIVAQAGQETEQSQATASAAPGSAAQGPSQGNGSQGSPSFALALDIVSFSSAQDVEWVVVYDGSDVATATLLGTFSGRNVSPQRVVGSSESGTTLSSWCCCELIELLQRSRAPHPT